MSSFGESSRAIVVFHWDKEKTGRKDGHVIVTQCRDGAVKFGDPQTRNRAAANLLKEADLAKKIIVLRVDNLEFTDVVKRCCKNRGE